jgi:hypothetical protein
MSDNSKVFRIGSLTPGGDVTEALGRYFAEFATLEFALLLVLSCLFERGDDHEVAAAVFKRVRNIADRIHIIRDVSKARKLPQKQIDAVEAMCEAFEKCNARRNVYAHAVYEQSGDGEIRIKTFVMTAGRKQIEETLTAKKIQQDIHWVQASLIIALTWIGKIPFEELRAAYPEKFETAPARQRAPRRKK